MARGVARAGFDIDLRDGQAREDAFAYVLLRARVEHKRDEKCRTTGNLFVEYEQRGRPSGIATTEADWWAWEYDNDCWVIVPTHRMKTLTRRAIREDRVVNGGDNNNYTGALVPLRWLLEPVFVQPPSTECGVTKA